MKNTKRYSVRLNDNQVLALQGILVGNLVDEIEYYETNDNRGSSFKSKEEIQDLLDKILRW